MIYHNYQFKVPNEKIVRVITNTDAKNEADDQFAIVQTLLSPMVDNVGFIAAHYGNQRHRDSMERSYKELELIFDTMGFDKAGMIHRGADHALPDTHTAVPSPGAELIICEALKDDLRPLFVTFMGPLTDLAAAYLMEPAIKGRLTAIWIGGGAYPDGGAEFNLGNDIHAANVVLSSGITLWQVPKNVYEMMGVSMAELELRVRPYGAIGAYLCDQLQEHAFEPGPVRSSFRTGETWVLGDNPTIGLILYEHRCLYEMRPAPFIEQDMRYRHSDDNPEIRVYKAVDSRLILEDMYAKIALFHHRNNKV
ncbi:MAG: nucleoside hydrolase [Christensenellales bacterium]|jgi:purine nucleosidase